MQTQNSRLQNMKMISGVELFTDHTGLQNMKMD